jgi:hypothetical protein
MPSTPTSVLTVLALAGVLVGTGVTNAGTSGSPRTEPVSVETATDTVAIECGGYDEDGTVVNEAATRIDRAPVDDAGVPEIPAVCGGYTAEGVFIGDD